MIPSSFATVKPEPVPGQIPSLIVQDEMQQRGRHNPSSQQRFTGCSSLNGARAPEYGNGL